MAPRGPPKGPPEHQGPFKTLLGPIWDPFGTRFGPILDPFWIPFEQPVFCILVYQYTCILYTCILHTCTLSFQIGSAECAKRLNNSLYLIPQTESSVGVLTILVKDPVRLTRFRQLVSLLLFHTIHSQNLRKTKVFCFPPYYP